jgi:hypothetical protein
MMKKQHGPALVRSLIPMTECPSCAGKGMIKGVFHELDCIGCHASGLVHADTLEPLPLEDLAVQLGMLLRRARFMTKVEAAETGIVAQYQQSNNRGAGRSSFKGD